MLTGHDWMMISEIWMAVPERDPVGARGRERMVHATENVPGYSTRNQCFLHSASLLLTPAPLLGHGTQTERKARQPLYTSAARPLTGADI